jgi:hypothetical protein
MKSKILNVDIAGENAYCQIIKYVNLVRKDKLDLVNLKDGNITIPITQTTTVKDANATHQRKLKAQSNNQ